MIIKVRNNSKYKEVSFDDCNARLETDLLDEMEALSLADELISAAMELLPPEYEESFDKLNQIRERLY